MIKGRENQAEAHAFNYGVIIPADKNTGRLTAIRQHEDVILTKEIDNASPMLFKACCSGETLQKVIIDWYLINDQGEEKKYFVHTFDEVKIVGFKQYVSHVKNPINEGYGYQEEISLRFRKIELNHPEGNIKATDDWTASRS